MDLDVFGGYELCTEAPTKKVFYFKNEYELSEEGRINIGNVLFTKFGQALYQSIEIDSIEGFWDPFCLPYWKECEKKEREGLKE